MLRMRISEMWNTSFNKPVPSAIRYNKKYIFKFLIFFIYLQCLSPHLNKLTLKFLVTLKVEKITILKPIVVYLFCFSKSTNLCSQDGLSTFHNFLINTMIFKVTFPNHYLDPYFQAASILYFYSPMNQCFVASPAI